MKILLTATVTPQVTMDLHLRDPGLRRQQYVESLRRWVPMAARHGAILVLVENSGADLERLAFDAVGGVPDHLRLLSAEQPAAEYVSRGKGAPEALMMDRFCETFFEDPAEPWYKCTGRLFVKNFSRCIPAALQPNAIVARMTLSLHIMDTRFFGASAGIWRGHFTDAAGGVSDPDDVPIEKVLLRRTFAAMGEGADLRRFLAQPAFLGQSGTHAGRVYDSPGRKLKRIVGNQVENALRGPLRRKQF